MMDTGTGDRRPPRASLDSARGGKTSCRHMRTWLGSCGVLEHLGDVLPVDQMIQERLEVIWPPIAVVDIVGVLPHIAAEDRLGAVHEGIFPGRRPHDDELAALQGQPTPARAQLADAGPAEA